MAPNYTIQSKEAFAQSVRQYSTFCAFEERRKISSTKRSCPGEVDSIVELHETCVSVSFII